MTTERSMKDFLLQHASSRNEVGEEDHDLSTEAEEIEDDSSNDPTVQFGLLDEDLSAPDTFIVIQRDGDHAANSNCDPTCTRFHPGTTVGGYTVVYNHSKLPQKTIRRLIANSIWSRRINLLQDSLNSRLSNQSLQYVLQKGFDKLGDIERCQEYWEQFLLETARDAFEGVPIRIVDQIEKPSQSLDVLKQQGYMYFDGSTGRKPGESTR